MNCVIYSQKQVKLIMGLMHCPGQGSPPSSGAIVVVVVVVVVVGGVVKIGRTSCPQQKPFLPHIPMAIGCWQYGRASSGMLEFLIVLVVF